MVFALAIIPIVESAAAVVMTGLEVIKGKWSLKIADYNKQISNLDDEPESSHAIGFVIPEEEDDYEDD